MKLSERLLEKLLTQMDLQIHFKQSHPDDTELIARNTMAGNFDFTPLVHEVERYGGITWIEVDEHGESVQEQASWGSSDSEQTTKTVTQQTSVQNGQSSGRTSATSVQDSSGRVSTLSRPVTQIGSRPDQRSQADSTSSAHGQTSGTSDVVTSTTGTTNGTSLAKGTGHTEQSGGSLGKSHSVSHKLMPLANPPIREPQPTGKLARAFQDQLEELKQWIACLPKRHAVVRIPGEKKAFEIVTADVPDPFQSIEAQMRAVEWVKRELFQIHAYHFTPDLSVEEEERRISAFIGEQAREVKPDLVIGRNGHAKPSVNGKHHSSDNGMLHSNDKDVYGY